MATDTHAELDVETDEEIEARARQMGWKPFAEYRGPPGKWSDARTFIAHGEDTLPILRDQNRRMSERLVQVDGEMGRLRSEVETLRNTTTEQAQAVKDAIALARRADQAGYNRALRELESERRVAVEAGDTVAFDQVQEQIDALMQTREAAEEAPPPAPPPPPPPPEPPAMAPEIAAFVEANPWFRTDAVLSQAMIDMHNAVIRESPRMGLAAQLETALGRMKKIYPRLADPQLDGEEEEGMDDDLEPARPRARANVLPPREPARQRERAVNTIANIADAQERAEAKRAFESIKKQDPGFTEAEYMQMLADPRTDVLELRAQRARK